jgi:predicted ATPase
MLFLGLILFDRSVYDAVCQILTLMSATLDATANKRNQYKGNTLL